MQRMAGPTGGARGAHADRPAMVHGRFQPLHNDHLEYILEAAAFSTSLVVGITNADATQVAFEASEPERSDPAANPFPFHLRVRMVRDALLEAGFPAAGLLVVPFPIHDPTRWADYVPPGAVHYLRVFSPWGAAKVDRLRAAGHEVVDLAGGRPKGISGSEVRRRLREGSGWEAMVPPAVVGILRQAGGLPPSPAPVRVSHSADPQPGR